MPLRLSIESHLLVCNVFIFHSANFISISHSHSSRSPSSYLWECLDLEGKVKLSNNHAERNAPFQTTIFEVNNGRRINILQVRRQDRNFPSSKLSII
jgi:hypothetical protein